ncbi:MAG: ABC transporter permease [Bacteroidales bacterium]|jgi:putative ABC transport system permease protein|nr:ABC transporter permease [Bacteroidales bacterium]
MVYLNLKLAFRSLVKNKVYSFIIICGFAIGFAACILIGLFYHAETTVNNDFANHKQIYRIYDVNKNRCNINWDLHPVLVTDYPAVENACPLDYNISDDLTIKDEQTSTTAGFTHLLTTTENFFSIFSVELAESLSGKAFAGRESVAVSCALARSLFGTEDPLGRQVNIGNYFFGTVTSVFRELPVNSTFSADIILNSENERFRVSSTNVNGFRYNPTNHFIQLREGINPRNFINELNATDKLKALDIDSLSLQRLDDIYLSDLTVKSRHAKGNPVLLKIFLAIALLILVLSSINYLNYSVSVHYARLRETGIKKTFGAGRKELVNYALTEVALGTTIALLLALALCDFALPYSDRLFGKAIQVSWPDLIAVAPVFLVVVCIVILINSLAPIYILSRFNIIESLSGFKGNINNSQIWKKILLTFQLTVSIALIAVVMIIYRQLNFVKHSDPGFDRGLLFRINIPYRFQQTEALRKELASLAFVKSTTLSSGCPGMINHRMDNDFEGKSVTFNCIYVGDNYLKTMGMELLQGRDFLDGDLNKSCLINEEACKQYGWESLEGKRYNNGQEGGFEIIGEIKNFKFESYHSAVEPLALLFTGANSGNVLSVRLSPGNTGQQVDQISKVWKSVSPFEPFSFIFYDEFFQSFYAKEDKLAGSITFFTIVAIVLTCMGIFGQIFMICLARVKEIGIRKINGATISEVLLLLNRDFILWFFISFIIASPAAWYIGNRWLMNFAYRTSLDFWIFMLAGLMALLIILVTVSWQSWRAATRNPVEALRYE